MAGRFSSLIERISLKRALRRWDNTARSAPFMDLATLRKSRSRARKLRRKLDAVIDLADSRLMLPMIGTDAIRRPPGSDWAYRPEYWRKPVTPAGVAAPSGKTSLGGEVTVFHDCKLGELALRQIRNARPGDLAPFGLRLEIFSFNGSFLSVVLDLPDHEVQGFSNKHLLRLDAIIELEKPLQVMARLNIKHGPNTEQVVRDLQLTQGSGTVEFDLAYTKLGDKPVNGIWIDLIFNAPAMNRIDLRDITLCRRPRAEL